MWKISHYIANVDTAGVPALGSNATMGGSSVRLTTKIIIESSQVGTVTGCAIISKFA